MTSLAESWRAARPPVAGLHLDSGACSRQSFTVIDAAAQHARHEAEVGGYVAAAAAAPALDAGRSAIAALTGMSASDVVYTTGANHSLDLLLSSWTGPRTVEVRSSHLGMAFDPDVLDVVTAALAPNRDERAVRRTASPSAARPASAGRLPAASR